MFGSKESSSIPEGAKILKKDVRIEVQEIENGFILSKNYDIKYQVDGETNWDYYCKKWFHKENPIDINDLGGKEEAEETLADKID